MKPIATLHWSDDDREYKEEFYQTDLLQYRIKKFLEQNKVFVLCMTSMRTPLPQVSSLTRFEARRSS